ncbi:MAG: UbiA family prenyltransferase, partial [Verrucomicrobia bacterium]|nr:UbiA family prenyltransferase [Verrucomicrobiota bacterium]
MLKNLRTILVLGRMSNLPTVWTNVMAGWFLAGGTWVGELWWVMTGVSLLYVGGMTLNDAFDAEWDAKHAVDRPIPAGAISWRRVWQLAWGQMLSGILVLIIFTDVVWYFNLALVL